MRKKKLKHIEVRWGLHGEIAAEIGCHINTVRNSLNGKYSSPKNIEIRELALKKYGGKYM